MDQDATRPLVVLDLGGVLVDESNSHARAAAAAAGAYFEDYCVVEQGSRLVTDERVAQFAALPGFDAHFRLAFALLYNLMHALPPSFRPPPSNALRPQEVHAAFKRKELRYGFLLGLSERNIEEELESIARHGGGIEGMRRAYRRDSIEGQLLYTGEVGATEREAAAAAAGDKEAVKRLRAIPENLVLRLCEELYLGDVLFQHVYGVAPLKPRGDGLVGEETLRIRRDRLEVLASRVDLALMANRPPALVERTLARFGLADLFRFVLTPVTDEAGVRRGDFIDLQPETFARLYDLDLAHFGAQRPPEQIMAVVDTLQDVAAAVAVGLKPVGVVEDRLMRRQFKELGARTAINRLETLVRAFERQEEP